ncbi:B3 domain-containing protein Os07g0563300-like isoform X2 [Ananas comosus]|uniref:B3 domain-containing protein Os07g0563300-like isoform X2 n=1 Tax=Ananas comosus TaxID=4615 RepID=A0A6P5F956_ANACO|nr:B3 domain-containing protein Os07g0563300-like isoform X2 [Ananas comosus]
MSSPQTPAAVAAPPKICFNTLCKEKLEATWRKGWRLRSGSYADLCARCFCTYEQGMFCETFHSDVAGWRNCETCGKRVHCGCIVSFHTYALLDTGGVDCITCARKSFVLTPNQMLHVKNWKPPTGPFPGHWMWNASSKLQQRLQYEFDRPSNIEKSIPGIRSSISAQEKKYEDLQERITSSTQNNQIIRERYANGDPSFSCNIYHRDDGNPTAGENDPTSKGLISDPCLGSSSGVNPEKHPNFLKEDSSPVLLGLAAQFSSPSNGGKDAPRAVPAQPQRQVAAASSQKQFYSHNAVDVETQGQIRNGRPRMDARARTQLLPRYWPRITDQELQQITGDSNSVITPLFEKMLSASDAGRIGRLVLPKKCAEAYFPAINQPEGLPLKVQDASGKEWVFQFRYWPNNNSRMYVLEGVTPCIQSMQLQAGDTVTFSRIDPEGKLVMGFRKASSISAEQDAQTVKSGPEGGNESTGVDSNANIPLRPPKGIIESRNPSSHGDQATLPKFDKGGFIQKDGPLGKSSHGPSKRKGSSLGSKSKRLRIENEDSMELKLSWEEAQELLRPPPNSVPSVVVIEGHEFEEFEEAPVLGKRTYFITNLVGDSHQWAQCEECSKWRKLPVDALLPYRFLCSDNKWEPERSSCLSAQELSLEQLAELIPTKSGPSRRPKVKVEAENIEVSDGLDTLANLAILGEAEAAFPSSSSASQQPTTKHPRHRPGCTCIVCIQPPSGKGPKHKQTCTCNVCLTVKRRFRTLMLRREKRQEAETARKQQMQKELQQQLLPPATGVLLPQPLGHDPSSTGSIINTNGNGNGDGNSVSPKKVVMSNEGLADEVLEHKKVMVPLSSPLKAQIDLNIQPEREEESSPKSDALGIMKLIRDPAA